MVKKLVLFVMIILSEQLIAAELDNDIFNTSGDSVPITINGFPIFVGLENTRYNNYDNKSTAHKMANLVCKYFQHDSVVDFTTSLSVDTNFITTSSINASDYSIDVAQIYYDKKTSSLKVLKRKLPKSGNTLTSLTCKD